MDNYVNYENLDLDLDSGMLHLFQKFIEKENLLRQLTQLT